MVKDHILARMLNNLEIYFFFEKLDFETKVKLIKQQFGDNFKLFNNSIECIAYVKSLGFSEDKLRRLFGWSNSNSDIDTLDLISDKKFYSLMKFEEGQLYSFEFNSIESGIFDSCECPVTRLVFDNYVVPYLNDKFYIKIDDKEYEQDITEDLFSKVTLGKHSIQLEKLIGGEFELNIYGKGMTKEGTTFEGVCNTPYIIGRRNTYVSVELKHKEG